MTDGTLLRATAACAIALLTRFASTAAEAAPLLRCQVAYAGTTHTIEASPVADPYPVPSVDIGGRFRFKAVMVGSDARVDRILLYAYLDTKRQPILVQQAKYLPPYTVSETPYLLTGVQHLYAGVVERELIYSCTLQGIQP
jgi:hypothetical protein